MRVTLCGFMSFLAKFGTRQTHGGGASGAGGICREGSAGRSNGWSGKENFRLISQWRAALPTRRECPFLSAPEKVRERPPAPCRARRAAERGRSRGPLHSASTQMTSPSKKLRLNVRFCPPTRDPQRSRKTTARQGEVPSWWAQVDHGRAWPVPSRRWLERALEHPSCPAPAERTRSLLLRTSTERRP